MQDSSRSLDDASKRDWQVGIDIGGTFTDVIAIDLETGETRSSKVPSRKDDPVEALVSAIGAVGLTWAEVSHLTHGTTMVTNDIIENLIDDVALITTKGFGDTVAIGRVSRREIYNLEAAPKAPPLVAAALRFEVDERLDRNGAVLTELTEGEIARVVAEVTASGVDAVAVCLIHGYRNGVHEQRIGDALRGVVRHVCLSHRISPEIKEYERTNTTVLSASVIDRVRRYLDRIEDRRPDGRTLSFFHSAGGMSTPAVVRDHPLMLAMSGPAAGVAASVETMKQLGLDRALTFDMGGTTTDTSLIVDGKAEVASDQSIADRRIRLPMVAVHSIGAGGGSIARMDNGVLKVGPRSAGSVPGPASYGRGGTEPTISDANIVLGYINPDRSLGGEITLDREAAVGAITPLALAARRSLEDTALGILAVANSAMVRALSKVTVERGVDGRSFPLFAYGGNGPMHAAAVARQYGIRDVLVPAFSSGFSALGCVAAGMSHSQQRTVNIRSTDWDDAVIAAIRDDILATISRPMAEAGYDPATCRAEWVALVRYVGQSFDIQIRAPRFDDREALRQQFYESHDALFGFRTDESFELVAIRASLTEPERPALDFRQGRQDGDPRIGTRICIFAGGGPVETPILSRARLPVDRSIPGPVIIEDDWSTVLVPTGDTFHMDARDHIHIQIGA